MKIWINSFLKMKYQNFKRFFEKNIKISKEENITVSSKLQAIQWEHKKLQKEALSDALAIERKNKLLYQLNEYFVRNNNPETSSLLKMIKNELKTEEIIGRSIKEFNTIDPDFFVKLSEYSQHKLSALELRHCAYIYLNLTTKEIASTFNIEPESVRVTKYRIKQKLNLQKQTNIQVFLQSLLVKS